MATFTKVPLSASTRGMPVKVAATATTGTTVHATGVSATTIDEVWLYAYNGSTAAVLLTIQYGEASASDDDIKLTVPPQSGLTLVVPGLVLSGTGAAAATVFAYASVANVVLLYGYVNRIA